MRYENFQYEYNSLMNQLLVNNIPNLPHAKKGIMSDGKLIQEYIGKDQIVTINEIFSEEFEEFGYPMIAI